jgi:Flp pilus assembly pilin Flp
MKMPLGMQRKMLGQGMTEYIIIVALVAVAAIGTFKFFGETARHQMAGLANEVAGQSATAEESAAVGTAGAASTDAVVDKGMGNYDNAEATQP